MRSRSGILGEVVRGANTSVNDVFGAEEKVALYNYTQTAWRSHMDGRRLSLLVFCNLFLVRRHLKSTWEVSVKTVRLIECVATVIYRVCMCHIMTFFVIFRFLFPKFCNILLIKLQLYSWNIITFSHNIITVSHNLFAVTFGSPKLNS